MKNFIPHEQFREYGFQSFDSTKLLGNTLLEYDATTSLSIFIHCMFLSILLQSCRYSIFMKISKLSFMHTIYPINRLLSTVTLCWNNFLKIGIRVRVKFQISEKQCAKTISEACSETYQTSKIERFANRVNHLQRLTLFTEHSILVRCLIGF